MDSITLHIFDHVDYTTHKDVYNDVTINATEPTCRDTAWIAPDGTFWPVKFANHHAFADAMCQRDGILKLSSDYGAVGALERTNWIHVSGEKFQNVRRILSRQMDTLFDWIMACGPDTSMGRAIKHQIDLYSDN